MNDSVSTTGGTATAGGVLTDDPKGEKGGEGSQSQAQTVDWKKEYEKLQAQSEQNIRGLRSSLDKQIAEQRAESAAKLAALEAQLKQTATSRMTPEELSSYEKQEAARRLQSLEDENNRLKAMNAQEQTKATWLDYFARNGVKVDPTKPLDELVGEGLLAVEEKLKTGVAPSGGSPTPDTPQTQQVEETVAPSVLTSSPKNTAGKTTWAELETKYKEEGGLERVFELLESGQLSPDSIEMGQ